MKIDPSTLPDFDLMIGGFPCQTFSTVGKQQGFNDERGQVIFGLMKILKEKNVKYFILENVKGFVTHDNGNALKTVLAEFDQLGYDVSWKVLNSINYGVPQSRERIYLVGIRKDIPHTPIEWETHTETGRALKECLNGLHGEPVSIYNESWQDYLNTTKNKGKFNEEALLKQDYLIIDRRNTDMRIYKEKTPTLRKGNHGLYYVYKKQLYKLNGYQGLMLQGFPKEYITKAKRANLNPNKLLAQAGNAMTVNVVTSVCNSLLKSITIE
jgi:DNA (cytosine-5)-methyltransferase 1